MKILLSIISILPAAYIIVFYILLPLKRKKAVAITPKLILLTSISLGFFILLRLQINIAIVLIILLLFMIAAAYFMNIYLVLNSSKEKITMAINRVSLGMSLKGETFNDQIYISELDLRIKILNFGIINILKFHSSTKSAKLTLFRAVTKKFITA